MADMADTGTSQHPFPLSAVLLPLFALIAILLSLPPLVWHAKNLNIAASSLILWLILLNTSNFLNSLIWATSDWSTWWMGKGYCDIQIRIICGAITGALPGCVLAISRALARVLDTKRQVVHQDRRDKIKGYVFESVICFGLPVFFMVAYYLVQNARYFIIPVYGCGAPYDRSWVSAVLFFIPPVIMCLLSTYYSSKFPSPPISIPDD
jgi:pheromone a factor receptor